MRATGMYGTHVATQVPDISQRLVMKEHPAQLSNEPRELPGLSVSLRDVAKPAIDLAFLDEEVTLIRRSRLATAML